MSASGLVNDPEQKKSHQIDVAAFGNDADGRRVLLAIGEANGPRPSTWGISPVCTASGTSWSATAGLVRKPPACSCSAPQSHPDSFAMPPLRRSFASLASTASTVKDPPAESRHYDTSRQITGPSHPTSRRKRRRTSAPGCRQPAGPPHRPPAAPVASLDAGRAPAVLTVEPLPERDHDGLGQRLACLRSQLPGELVRLVTLDAQRKISRHAGRRHSLRLSSARQVLREAVHISCLPSSQPYLRVPPQSDVQDITTHLVGRPRVRCDQACR